MRMKRRYEDPVMNQEEDIRDLDSSSATILQLNRNE